MMKKTIFISLLCLAAAIAHAAPKTGNQDLNGLWADASSPSFRNCYLIIAQEGSDIHTAHYLEFNGTPMVEYGQGNIDAGKIVLQIKVSKPIPGWSTSGMHTLQLSADGNSLRGEYDDGRGN